MPIKLTYRSKKVLNPLAKFRSALPHHRKRHVLEHITNKWRLNSEDGLLKARRAFICNLFHQFSNLLNRKCHLAMGRHRQG